MSERSINRRFCTDQIHVDLPPRRALRRAGPTGVDRQKRWGITPVRVSHAKLLVGGTQDTSTAEKDKFICYWYHTPNSGEGYVHGYPIEWDEAHLLIRLDPNWNYLSREFIPNTDTAKVEKNIDQQFKWGRTIFEMYAARKPAFPMSYHMVGPRAADSMFYVQRVEGER